MAFNATCPACAAKLRVEERLIGQIRKCPKCGERFQIHNEPERPEPDFPTLDHQPDTQDCGWETKSLSPSIGTASRISGFVHQKRTLTVAAALVCIVCAGSLILWSRARDSVGTEAEARAKLLTTLDSWALGDSRKKFESEHGGILFSDMDFIHGLKLSRFVVNRPYRVVPHREKEGQKSHEFSVTLFLTTKDGVSEEPTVYLVTKEIAGMWVIENKHHFVD